VYEGTSIWADTMDISTRHQIPQTSLEKAPQKVREIMLVLTRKRNEKIQIGSEIVITVTQIKNGKVNLGIEAPAQIRILRSDLPEFVPKTGNSIPEFGNPTQWISIGKQNCTANPESPLYYNTDFAVEIENQIHCPLSP
jgi:carbon storage regulator